MHRTIHVVERIYRDDGSGGQTWTSKPACDAASYEQKDKSTANVIADHKGPIMCQPCLKRKDPNRHRFGLLVGLPVEDTACAQT